MLSKGIVKGIYIDQLVNLFKFEKFIGILQGYSKKLLRVHTYTWNHITNAIFILCALRKYVKTIHKTY